MRKLLTLSYVLCVAGFACIAHAQLSQTGAGPKAGGGGGGGYTPCSGTAVHMNSPNDLSNGAFWTNDNLPTVTFTATDPNSVANNATRMVSNAGTGAFSVDMHGAGANIFTGAVATGIYAFSAYAKAIAGPPWMFVQVQDTTFAHAFGGFINMATSVAGTPSGGGRGVADCMAATAAGNGYTQFSWSGHFITSDVPNVRIVMLFCDTNGTCNPTLNQEFDAWAVSP